MTVKDTYDWYAKEGYLKAIPNGKLTLYNYTTRCVVMGNWNYHTRNARGLILDAEGNYVARPFQKFWAINEIEETYLKNLPQEEVELAEKYDGSLVIVFENPETGEWDAVTRGCWDNEQTRFAKNWLRLHRSSLKSGFTHCFELIAPWNHIVIPYKQTDMILTGKIDKYGLDTTYSELHAYATIRGFTPARFITGRVEDIDLEEIDFSMEGWVARYPSGYRVKLKSPDYVDSHAEAEQLRRQETK